MWLGDEGLVRSRPDKKRGCFIGGEIKVMERKERNSKTAALQTTQLKLERDCFCGERCRGK